MTNQIFRSILDFLKKRKIWFALFLHQSTACNRWYTSSKFSAFSPETQKTTAQSIAFAPTGLTVTPCEATDRQAKNAQAFCRFPRTGPLYVPFRINSPIKEYMTASLESICIERDLGAYHINK